MIRIERSTNAWPEQVKFYANEGNYKRQMISGYCYPKYDESLRLMLNCSGLGFELQVEDATNLRDLLTEMLKEFK